MKKHSIILSTILAFLPLSATAQNNWARYPQWLRYRSNPPQFLVVGEDPAFFMTVDKKLIPLGGDKYGFIFRNQIKVRKKGPAPDYSEVYGIIDCKTGNYDVEGRLRGDNRGNVSYFPQCKGPDCLSPYPDEPDPMYVRMIHKDFCPKN